MVEDDDGTPDEDMPPLDRERNIHKFCVDAVCLLERTDLANVKGAVVIGGRSGNLGFNANVGIAGKKFLRVHMPAAAGGASYVLRVTPEMRLEDLMPVLSHKHRLSSADANACFEARDYKFEFLRAEQHKMDSIEMDMLISDVQSDELRLVRRIPDVVQDGRLLGNDADGDALVRSRFLFSEETACAYSEYTVVKYNGRGKAQERVIGVDANFIYNKYTLSARSKRAVRAKQATNPKRPISSVQSCQARAKACCFTICYREMKNAGSTGMWVPEKQRGAAAKSVASGAPSNRMASLAYSRGKPTRATSTASTSSLPGGSPMPRGMSVDSNTDSLLSAESCDTEASVGRIVSRDFEAETHIECAEIVAKINFLIARSKEREQARRSRLE
jgi:hypothetical protein